MAVQDTSAPGQPGRRRAAAAVAAAAACAAYAIVAATSAASAPSARPLEAAPEAAGGAVALVEFAGSVEGAGTRTTGVADGGGAAAQTTRYDPAALLAKMEAAGLHAPPFAKSCCDAGPTQVAEAKKSTAPLPFALQFTT